MRHDQVVIDKRDIIVIGTSAGGVEALTALVTGLPKNLPAAIFVAMHTPALGQSALPHILASNGKFAASHPRNQQAIEHSHLYIAPPDFHLLLEPDERITLSHGPKEGYWRPAINPLFRSAAETYGDRVVGVLLTGVLDDGVAGLAAIKQRRGITIVQDPTEAAFPDMPKSALNFVPIDHVLRVAEMPKLFLKLATGANKEWL